MQIKLINTYDSISRSDLLDLEKMIGGKLPLDFFDFYLSYNGGDVGNDDSNSLLLSGFVPIKFGKIPMEIAYKELKDDFPYLIDKLPFAFDEGGNYFLLTVSGSNLGEVGLWIMDTEEYEIVADSFAEFLERLASE